MREILDKVKRLRLADNKTVSTIDVMLAQFETYKNLNGHDLPFISCSGMEKAVTCNFINCFSEDTEPVATKSLSNLSDGIVAKNAVFLDVPEPNDAEAEDLMIVETFKNTDCIIFISDIKNRELLPLESRALRILSKAMKKHFYMFKKLIFVIYSESTISENLDELIQKRKNDISSILEVEDTTFFTLFPNLCLNGKKQNDESMIKESGILEIRNYISEISGNYISKHLVYTQYQKREIQGLINELLAQVSQKLNILYNVLSCGEDIQNRVDMVLADYKNRIQNTLSSELKVFETIPETVPITFDFTPPQMGEYKSEKAALAAAQEILAPLYHSRENLAYQATIDVATTFRAALKYANPDYHCFEHINHVVIRIIGDCITELSEYHINLSKALFAGEIPFLQSDEFVGLVSHFERDLRDYVVLPEKKAPLSSYLSKVKITPTVSGQAVFGIKKYTYTIENLPEVIKVMEYDMNSNLDSNKEVVWRGIQFIQQKYLINFKEIVNQRVGDLEQAAKRVYSHPQVFKDLEFELENVVEVQHRIQDYLKTL